MILAVREALELGKSSATIISMEPERLASLQTTPGHVLPNDLLNAFAQTIHKHADLYGGYMHKPEIKVSHAEILSVAGENVYIDPNGLSNFNNLFASRHLDDEVEVSVKYNRIQVKIKVGTPNEYQDTFGFLYALDRSKFIIAAGKTVSICNNLNIFGSDYMFRSTPTTVGDGLRNLDAFMPRYMETSDLFTRLLNEMKDIYVTQAQLDAVIADHHYRSSMLANGVKKSESRQVFTDDLLKRAHYLMFNTHHPYRLEENPDREPDFVLGTVYDVYNCFTEALQNADKDLTASFDKTLNIYNYFSQFRKELPMALISG